jgi:hypothetical protein
MIDDIVEMVLKEANTRPSKDPIERIGIVEHEVRERMSHICENIAFDERRKREDENKG